MLDHVPQEATREGGHAGQVGEREGLGFLLGGFPELTPLSSRLLGDTVWVKDPVSLGIGRGDDGRRPLGLAPHVDMKSPPNRSRHFFVAAVTLWFSSSDRALASRADVPIFYRFTLPEAIF